MTRRALATISLAGLFFACLPELSPLLPAPASDAGDAGEDIATPPACGDGFIDDDAGEGCDPGGSVTTTCTNCTVECPDGGRIDPSSRHCYWVASSDAVTNAQAVELCSGGHLVTIGSAREAELVDGLARGAHWVGLRFQDGIGFQSSIVTEPGFSTDAGCAGCFVRALTTSDGGTTSCVVSADGGWAISNCSAALGAAVCEREPLGQRSFYCQGPYCSTVTFTLGTKRYLLYLESSARTADAAAAECANYAGGKLVVFESREEREQVVQEILRLLGGETSFTAWIGIASDGGTWTWDDGQPVDDGGRPSPWGANQPGTVNAGRAFIRIGPAFFDSQLAQVGEDIARPFICQRAP